MHLRSRVLISQDDTLHFTEYDDERSLTFSNVRGLLSPKFLTDDRRAP